MNKRQFLAALAALGIRAPLWAQAPRAAAAHRRAPPHPAAGVHERDRHTAQRSRRPTGRPARSLEEIDRAGIGTAMLSLVQPGVWFGDVAEAGALRAWPTD